MELGTALLASGDNFLGKRSTIDYSVKEKLNRNMDRNPVRTGTSTELHLTLNRFTKAFKIIGTIIYLV